jgi:hypothetical protein
MIEMNCPRCGKFLRIPDQHKGRTGKCNGCGGTIVVPGSTAFSPPMSDAQREYLLSVGTPLVAIQNLSAAEATLIIDDLQSDSSALLTGVAEVPPHSKKLKMPCGCWGWGAFVVIILVIIGNIVGPQDAPLPSDHNVHTSNNAPVFTPAPTPSAAPDLSQIRQRIQAEIDSSQSVDGNGYRIQELTFKDNQITLTLDLQFRPSSAAFLEKEAKDWTDMVLHGTANGEYVAKQQIHVRTSLRSYLSASEIIDWGSYRHSGDHGTWSPGSGMRLFENRPITPPGQTQSPNNPQQSQELIVYVAPTGRKYHKQSCKTVRNGNTVVSLSAAQARGYEACKVCGG